MLRLVLAIGLIAAPPAVAQQDSAAWAPAIARAREAMRTALAGGTAPGAAVAVAVAGRVVWEEGFGWADLERHIPAGRHTRFGVGSISKAFTLAAALTLADAARLDLDAPVERYLPDFPHPGRGITVRRIGVHQSGLRDDFASSHYYTTTHFPDLDSAYRWIRAESLAYRPGTRSEYATGLFTIVGRVLEEVEGRPYLEIMRRRVFLPASMAATRTNDPRVPDPARARFYQRGNGGFEPTPAADPSFKLPGAGFLSTAGDVARFGAALLHDGLLSQDSRREMFTPVPLADGTPAIYALGFQVRHEDGRRVLVQPGGGPGIGAWLAIYPDHGLAVALLSNATQAPLEGARRAVAAAFLSD